MRCKYVKVMFKDSNPDSLTAARAGQEGMDISMTPTRARGSQGFICPLLGPAMTWSLSDRAFLTPLTLSLASLALLKLQVLNRGLVGRHKGSS